MEVLYNHIGKNYDVTRQADLEIVNCLKRHLQVEEGLVLDVACGTGNYTVALKNAGLDMVGVDVSDEMIRQAQEKMKEINWNIADVKKLPFSSRTFKGATCILAIHHFDHLVEAFQEVYRVIDEGRFVIFTSSPEQMDRYWLKEYFPVAMKASAKQMPALSRVTEALRTAGFEIIGNETFLVQPDLKDFFLYSGKYDPAMYLDPKVRSGISTFANLASQEEIEEGCRRLQQDIMDGKIKSILNTYSSDHGDYAFIVAEKRTI